MELTQEEKQELNHLAECYKNNKIIPEQLRFRTAYLSLKKWHNNCINLKCIGHHGIEEHKYCPHCGYKLAKLIT